MTRLSVVVPARDAEATVGRTVAGLVGHPDVAEVIVVDDASTDGTASVAAAAGARVLAGPGTGPAAARNAGVVASTGDLLGFCDADDEWLAPVPDPRIAALADPEVDGAWGRVVCRTVPVDGGDPIDAAPTHLGALHGLLVRRAAFDRVGPLEPSMQLGEDLDWILRARRTGLRIAMLDEPCYRYHLRPGSLSAGEGRRARGLLAAARLAAQRAASDAVDVAPVAVVVPVADGERYLGDALASIRAQQPRPALVIVGDDASTDGSAGVAAEAGATVVSLPARLGPNAARMAAMDAVPAEIELVAFCDADDLWTEGRLAALLAALDREPAAAGVLCQAESFASPDRDVSAFEVPVGPQAGVVIGALLIRRADLAAVGGLRTDLAAGEVVALERALVARGRHLLRIDDVGLRRRVHGDNLTIRQADEVRQAYLRLAVEQVRGSGA